MSQYPSRFPDNLFALRVVPAECLIDMFKLFHYRVIRNYLRPGRIDLAENGMIGQIGFGTATSPTVTKRSMLRIGDMTDFRRGAIRSENDLFINDNTDTDTITEKNGNKAVMLRIELLNAMRRAIGNIEDLALDSGRGRDSRRQIKMLIFK